MSTETTPALRLSENTRIRLPVAMLLALLGVVAAAAIAWSGDHNAVADHSHSLGQHDVRLRKLEEGQAEIRVMKNDVEWIRRTIEQQQQRERRAP